MRRQLQSQRLGVGDQPFGVHGHVIHRTQQPHGCGVGGAGGNLGETDQFESPLGIAGAQQQFLAAAARGDQADSYLDQSHVAFGRRLRPRRMHRNLAAAAERHAERRRDHRLGSMLDRHIGLLIAANRAVQILPLTLLRHQ